MGKASETPQELEAALGARLKQLRLSKALDQRVLAQRAGVSVKTLRNLEGGHGSSLKTLMSVLRALGREDWLKTIAPVATINPLHLTRQAEPRQRAPRKVSRVAA